MGVSLGMKTPQLLDETLIELSNHNFTTKTALFPKQLSFELHVLNKDLLFEQLERDGYATLSEESKSNSYWITYSGLMLIEKGGYKRKIRGDRISSGLDTFQFWVLVAAAICASLYYAYEIVKIVYSFVFA